MCNSSGKAKKKLFNLGTDSARDLFEWLGLGPCVVLDFSFIASERFTPGSVRLEQKHPAPVLPETNKRFKKIPKNLKCRNVADKAVFKCERQIFV